MPTYPEGRCTVWSDDPKQPVIEAWFTPPKEKRYPEKWLVLWQSTSDIGVSMTEQAKMEKPLSQTEYRVRDYLIGTIGLGNYVYVNQADLARELRVRRASVCDAIKRLIALGILLQGPKSGRSNTYMVNPAFCFSGGLGNGVKARRDAIKAKIHEFKKD